MDLDDTLTVYSYLGNLIFMVFGTICISSSILVLYICIAKCDGNATEIRLIIIFCSAEIFSSLEFILYSILRFIYGYHVIDKGTDVCKFSAFAIMLFCRISLINISVLAALRYLIVCHQLELKLSTWLIILASAIFAATVLFSVGFYTDDAAPSVSYMYCFFFSQPNLLSKIMLYLIPVLFIIPCWITTYCYFCVGWTANKRLNLAKQEAVNNSDDRLLKAIGKEKLKLATQILFVFIIYNVNFGVSYITWILKFAIGYKRTIPVDAAALLQANLTAFLNPVVTIIFQPDINNEFKLLWIKFKLKINLCIPF
jgi:hypothetical protein